MPVLGYNVAGVNSNSLLSTTMHGHFDSTDFAVLGSVVGSSFQVNSGHAYVGKTNSVVTNVQMGLYNAANPSPALWPLVLSSNVLTLTPAFGVVWVNFTWPVTVIPAGTYALGIVSDQDWNVWQRHDVKASGPVTRPGSTPGVLPNPLGATANLTRQWSLYIDWTASGPGPVATVTDPPHCCDC